MADNGYVAPLSGEEIVNDILSTIESKLSKDCNLRAIDAYSRGYSAKIKIDLKLFGTDDVEVQVVAEGGEDISSEVPPDEIEEVHADIEIAPEAALNEVRSRSGQDIPTLISDETSAPTVVKRTYKSRTVKSSAVR